MSANRHLDCPQLHCTPMLPTSRRKPRVPPKIGHISHKCEITTTESDHHQIVSDLWKHVPNGASGQNGLYGVFRWRPEGDSICGVCIAFEDKEQTDRYSLLLGLAICNHKLLGIWWRMYIRFTSLNYTWFNAKDDWARRVSPVIMMCNIRKFVCLCDLWSATWTYALCEKQLIKDVM